ncbi:MAG: VOC family protein [Candidatus Hermodarchaeota archaeon]
MERINFNFDNLKVDQLGYVYKDIEKQAKILETIYGLPKFAFLESYDAHCKYRGKDCIISTKLALSKIFNVQIELIQYINGECIFKEFLDSGREGLHHFGIFVDELDAIVKAFTEKGYEILHQRQIGKQKIAYLDTVNDLGILLEFQETIRRKKRNT